MLSEEEIDRIFANIRERFGAKLSDEQAAVVRKSLSETLAAGEAMRATPLDNADEPFTVFTPFTPSGAGEQPANGDGE